MSVTTKLVGFLVLLGAVFAGAMGVGSAVGPVGALSTADHAEGGHNDSKEPAGESAGTAASVPKGLMVSQDGYTFRLTKTSVSAGRAVPVAFTIEDPDGNPVTEYDVEHEKDLHLVALRRDFSGFQHVHPEMGGDGVWTTTLNLSPGQWRLFADFKARGAEPLTLGNDLAVRGDYEPVASPPDSRSATVDDFAVTLDGDLAAGEEAKLTLSVTRDGNPVTDLEPYLGAYGHLVALRAGDLAYLHVHPEGTPGDGVTNAGPEVVFYTEVPSPGRYHLYLDFKHQGVVRTAAFTVTVGGESESESESSATDGSEDGHSSDDH